MPTPTSYQESPSATLPAPYPTQPVAGRPVDSATPVFDWTPIPDAARYRVQIATTEAFDTIYYDEQVERGDAISLGSTLPGDAATAYWRVRAETEAGDGSVWSEPAHFAASSAEPEGEEGTVRLDAPPTPIHPETIREAPVDVSAVPFSWEGVPEALGYRFQVASAEDFDDPVVDLTVDRTTSITLHDVLSAEDRSFYWRVRPLFRAESTGPWSHPVSFTVAPPAEEEEDLAPEAADPQASARAAGPVEHARTSRATTLTVSLLAVLSFIATLLLTILFS